MKLSSVLLGILVTAAANAQETTIMGFVDVDYLASDNKANRPAFFLGQYDHYITSEITERVSFLGESVFEFDEDHFAVDVERIIIKYNFADYFNILAGKHHTPIGYWNNAYHHGTVLQPTTRRPLLFYFEDEGGILPIHTTGVMFSGSNISSACLGYDLLIGNGIGSTPISDNDNAKSVTFRLRANPRQGLEIGASAYIDGIAANSLNQSGDTLHESIDQKLWNGYVTYFYGPVEFAGEFVSSSNTSASAGTKTTTGYYVYAGYRLGTFVPYVRLDELRFESGEEYYKPSNVRLVVIGIRQEISYIAAMKLEYRNVKRQNDRAANEMTLQFAVGF